MRVLANYFLSFLFLPLQSILKGMSCFLQGGGVVVFHRLSCNLVVMTVLTAVKQKFMLTALFRRARIVAATLWDHINAIGFVT